MIICAITEAVAEQIITAMAVTKLGAVFQNNKPDSSKARDAIISLSDQLKTEHVRELAAMFNEKGKSL